MTKVADSVYMVEGTGNETAVIVDGQPFPWHIAPEVYVENLDPDHPVPLYGVTITLYIDEVGVASLDETFFSAGAAKAEGQRIAQEAVCRTFGEGALP